MKHQFNRTLHIITPILVGKFSKFTPPHYFEARDVSVDATYICNILSSLVKDTLSWKMQFDGTTNLLYISTRKFIRKRLKVEEDLKFLLAQITFKYSKKRRETAAGPRVFTQWAHVDYPPLHSFNTTVALPRFFQLGNPSCVLPWSILIPNFEELMFHQCFRCSRVPRTYGSLSDRLFSSKISKPSRRCDLRRFLDRESVRRL